MAVYEYDSMSSMASPAAAAGAETIVAAQSGNASAVSWGAIFAGASVAAASSLVLLTLAVGLGYLSLSWPYVSGARIAAEASIALIILQWVSSALGGYITGRLRTRWVGLHTHEVFFRDTAHGFITWSVATLAAAFIFAFGAAGLTHEADTALNTATAAHEYAERSSLSSTPSRTEAEPRHIAVKLQRTDPDDSTPDDQARKAAAKSSVFVALSMLIGAFIASASAALGGRLRDLHP